MISFYRVSEFNTYFGVQSNGKGSVFPLFLLQNIYHIYGKGFIIKVTKAHAFSK